MSSVLTEWQKLVKKTMAQNKGKKFGEILKIAKKNYTKKGTAKNNR